MYAMAIRIVTEEDLLSVQDHFRREVLGSSAESGSRVFWRMRRESGNLTQSRFPINFILFKYNCKIVYV